MSKTNPVAAVLILAAVSLSCTLFKFGSGNSAYGVGDLRETMVPKLNGGELFPALTTDAINALVAAVPELAKHRDKILEAERSAVNGIFDEIRAKSQGPISAPRIRTTGSSFLHSTQPGSISVRGSI